MSGQFLQALRGGLGVNEVLQPATSSTRKKPKRMTEAALARFVELADQGKSTAEIAADTGYHRDTVNDRLRRIREGDQ